MSDHLAVVATVTPGPGRQLGFLSVIHGTLAGKSAGWLVPVLAESRDRDLGMILREPLADVVGLAVGLRRDGDPHAACLTSAASTSISVCVLPDPGGALTTASRPPSAM